MFLVVFFGFQFFLLSLLASKFCVVSYVDFPILEISCMSFQLYYSHHLQICGSYIEAFVRGLA